MKFTAANVPIVNYRNGPSRPVLAGRAVPCRGLVPTGLSDSTVYTQINVGLRHRFVFMLLGRGA